MTTLDQKAPAIISETDATPGTATSTDWSIKIMNIGKTYKLGEVMQSNDNFREDVVNWFKKKLGGSSTEKKSKGPRTFDALKNINLEFNKGDTVGIIGHNGAGKSTLLKILSRITHPTTGDIRYRGKLASLLEVGTGFHRELTGRENIFLNGSILGMKRADINKQLDDIIEFAGVEKFLDTPVKFYSSGMHVRLAFAVAAHLRTDILIVDEVLAVGDAEFQKRCLGKMEQVAQDGRTVLFVSHNMGAVSNLCKKGVVLKNGEIIFTGSSDDAVQHYTESNISSHENRRIKDLPRDNRLGELIKIVDARILNEDNDETYTLNFNDTFQVELRIDFYSDQQFIDPMVGIDSAGGNRLGTSVLSDSTDTISGKAGESKTIRTTIRSPRLAPGFYTINLGIRKLDLAKNALSFEVLSKDAPSSITQQPMYGNVCFDTKWNEMKQTNTKKDELF